MPEHDDALPFSAEVSAEFLRWSAFLGDQKRMSPKTVEAYRRDVTQFLLFMSDHLGDQPSLTDLAELTRKMRAFMASRRAKGIGSRALMRQLAGARSFARHLERNGKGKVGALNAVRAPEPRRHCRSHWGCRRPNACPTPVCARAKSASPGFFRATRRFWHCSMARGYASPKRSASNAAMSLNLVAAIL